MGPRRVGNPPQSSLPPPRPPDPSQFKLKLQTHKEEVTARFSKLRQSMTALAAEQEEFQRELREELRQLRLSYSEPSLPQPNSNPPTTIVSTPSPLPGVGNPSSPSYCQSQSLKCQLPPLILNCKPQTQILPQKPPANFSLPQAVANPPHTPTVVTTAPHQILPQIHHTPSAKLHERKLKLGRVHPKTRIRSLLTLKRKCRLTFSHQKQTQTSGDAKATWVNRWVKYCLCKSQKQFFGRLQLQGLCTEGLHQSVLVPTAVIYSLDLFIKLFVKVLISGTSVDEICDMKLNVEFFRNGSKLSVRQATKGSGKSEVLILDQETNFQQRVSYLEKATGLLKNNFGLSFASIALYYGDYEQKQLKFGLVLGLFVYTSIMQPEHEHVIGSNMNQVYNPNCGVKWVIVVHICNQPSNSSIEVIGFLIADLELSHGRYDNITWFLLLNLCSVLSTIDSNIFFIAVTKNRKDKNVLTLSHLVVMSDRRFKAAILVFPKFGEYFVATVLLNKMKRDDHLIAVLAFLVKDNSGCINNGELEQFCKELGQVWRYVWCINKFGQFKKLYGDMCFSTLLQERLNSTLSLNIYIAMLPKEFYIGSSFGAMEVMGVKKALLWDKVLTGETLIKSFSVHNFSSEAFEVNCEMINDSLQLGINPCAVTDNCSFKEFEIENLYELIIDDLYKLIGQHCSMFLWIISASVKLDLKLLFRVTKNFKPTGNLFSNALYDVLGVTLIIAISINKTRKIIMVMSNAVHEPCKTTCVQVLIEVSKTLQLVEDEITKLDGLFDNGPMHFPHIKSATTPLRNSLKLSLEHSKQVKVFSLQVSHKKNICQQRCSYLAESKINQDAATHANTLGMRYWFSWKLLRYANTTILTKNMMVGPQYDLMNGSFGWVTVHKLKEVIRNTEQWIEESCMEYQVGQTVIKFSLPCLSETHELKFTLVKLKLMELISVFEIASDNEEQGTQYTKSCSGLDQSMKLGSHFEKWHQSNATAPFGSQCVLGNKAAATIVACGVIALAKQEESTWVCLLLLVYISLEKHEDMLYFKGCGLLGSYFYGT